MGMRISVDDPDWSISVSMSVSGGYNPDILDDLQRRAMRSYTEALTAKEQATGRVNDALEPADTEPMTVDDTPVAED